MPQDLQVALAPLLAALALAAAFLATAAEAQARSTEHFGNDAVPAGFPLPPGGHTLANLPSRAYWREVNGDPVFFYQGDAAALNEALEKLAALGGVKEVVLLPGPGEVRSLIGDKTLPCDWTVHLPAGLSYAFALRKAGKDLFPADAVLTVYVPAPRASPADPKVVGPLLTGLGADAFADRERATKGLEALGAAAAQALREALANKPSAEARSRIEALLARLPRIDLGLLKVPAGVEVVEVKDLVKRYREGLKADDPTARGLCVGALGGLAEHDGGLVEVLTEVLKKDPHEYVRRSAAGVLGRLGRRATAALPALKEGLKDKDANVANAFKGAVDAIEAAKEDAAREDKAKGQKAVLEDISKFREALPPAHRK